jgi:hypothetical protein
MNKKLITLTLSFGIFVLTTIMLGMAYVTYSNSEKTQRNRIVAKQVDNKNEQDAMWKTISQVAQVSEKDRSSLMELFNSYAQSRTGVGDSKAIMNWIKEAVPNVDTKTMVNLQNVIVAQRDGFKFRQKELLDFKREHDNMIDLFPSSLFVGGRGKIDVIIVTSTRTENAFKTGKDDDVNLFNSNK